MTTTGGILGYREFLKLRDGEPDVYRPSLARREEFFAHIESEPVRSNRTFDRAVFLRNLPRVRLEPGLDDLLLWLIWTAKANQAERFGIELARVYGLGAAEGAPPEEVHPGLQEFYHTRILADVVGMFRLPVPSMPPPRVPRAFIKWMIFSPFPERFNLPLIGASEMLGCVMFRLLRDRGLELLTDEPEVCERMSLLFDEILADELCHVGLIEAKLGRWGRRAMHALFGLMAKGSSHSRAPLPQAFGQQRIERAYAEPSDLPRMVAEFPGKAFAF